MGHSTGMVWTPELVAQARTLRATGMQFHAIGVKMGLRESQVRSALRPGRSTVDQPARNAHENSVTEENKADKPLSTTAAIHTSRTRAESYLVVPDLQAPFQAQGALEFCERVRREFGVPKDNILFTGDEVDNFHGKGLDKARDPDAEHTPRQELAAAVDELKRWYAMYPSARLAVSNHGTRYERRAAEAEISSQWMRIYRDVIEAPVGWEWRQRWVIQASKQPFVLEHGHEGAGRTEAKVLENGYSTVHGHFTKAATVWVSNHMGRRLWGQCAAALIDHDAYAFRYAKKYPRKADNGVSVIMDGGRIPIWVPFYG